MKKKTIVGLITIVAITVVVIFSGCVEEKVAVPPPKYCKGDIITNEDGFIDRVILEYNAKTDEYKVNFIHKGIFKNDTDKWSYISSDYNSRMHDRDFIEEYYPTKLYHVSLSTIMTEREYRNQDEYRELLSQPMYARGDVIVCKDHLRVILDYNKTTDEYKTTWVQDTDAIGLCYVFFEESSTYARWQSRKSLEERDAPLGFVYDHVDPSKIKSVREYYNEKYS
jgi:hypothetical protein